jgi:aminopeptidase
MCTDYYNERVETMNSSRRVKMNQTLLEKYAKVAVVIGANVQKNQRLIVNSSTETKELAREIAKQGYLAGAKSVDILWNDAYVSRYGYEYMSDEELTSVPEWIINRYQFYVNEGACLISIASPITGVNEGVNPQAIQKSSVAVSKAIAFFRNHTMANHTQWCVIAAPNPIWASKVFPNVPVEQAVELLWNAILKASRVTESNDPVAEWNQHNATLANHNKILNDYQFESLHFKNSVGTDVVVSLVKNHIWAGGCEHSSKGVLFNPNIPTEETFTMPHKLGVHGKVVATKPLEYQGNLIEDFYLIFKDGKVVEYGAKKNQDTLKNLLTADEGSSRLGEIALLSHDSPISNSGILFLNTLFDENASCHMALGRAYPINVQGGVSMSSEELEKVGYNQSMVHSDFMFGSACMQMVGYTFDGTEVVVFKDGNFVI